MKLPCSCDIAILGGGLAGLALALHLKRRLPSVDVILVEKGQYPVPELTHRVGESMVEVSSWYFRHTLGLADHLANDQLPKFGLRFFMHAGDNRDIAKRVEFGPLQVGGEFAQRPFRGLPLPTYNIDRGRIENVLLGACQELGVRFLNTTEFQKSS